MAKQTSINVQPVKGGSEEHNKRKKKLDYVRKDLSHLNEYWECDTQANRLANIKALYQSKTGQKMQAKATPIREGVVVIQESTTMADLHRLADAYRDRLGIEVFQIAIHRDEGYQKSKDWKPNLHAHLVFDWTNHSTGKSVKLNRQKMAEMQTITAEVLGMERGQSSEKKHLTAQQFKAAAEAQRAEQLKEQVAELSTAKAAKEETINTIKTVGKYVVDAVTGKAKAKENALQERVTKLEVQLPTEREKGRQEGGKQVLQAILSAARLKLEDLTPENIGKRWRLWFDKAKSLEQEVKQLKEAAEAQKEAAYWAKINFGNERYREGLKGSDSLYLINICIFIEQFGYGFGFTAYMLYLIYFADGEHKTAHYAICTAFMALGMMIPGMAAGWLQEQMGYNHFFIWIMICCVITFGVTALLKIDPEFGKKKG